jgi:integrase
MSETLSVKAVRQIVLAYARRRGLERMGSDDLHWTCARLCDDAGELAQIQMLLGHSSAEITHRYIGSGQSVKQAVNDQILPAMKQQG